MLLSLYLNHFEDTLSTKTNVQKCRWNLVASVKQKCQMDGLPSTHTASSIIWNIWFSYLYTSWQWVAGGTSCQMVATVTQATLPIDGTHQWRQMGHQVQAGGRCCQRGLQGVQDILVYSSADEFLPFFSFLTWIFTLGHENRNNVVVYACLTLRACLVCVKVCMYLCVPHICLCGRVRCTWGSHLAKCSANGNYTLV